MNSEDSQFLLLALPTFTTVLLIDTTVGAIDRCVLVISVVADLKATVRKIAVAVGVSRAVSLPLFTLYVFSRGVCSQSGGQFSISLSIGISIQVFCFCLP